MRKLKTRTFTGTKNPEVTKREMENRALAGKAAADGMVLLKNEKDLLPLKENCKVALYGVGAGKTVKGGTGSGDVNERHSVTIAEGLRNAGVTLTTESWLAEYDRLYDEARLAWRDEILQKAQGENDVLNFFNIYSTTPFYTPAGPEITQTDTTTAIYVISRISGEGADRFAQKGDYYLSDEEEAQLKAICETYAQVLVVLNTGGIMDLSFLDRYDNIHGLLLILQPGMEGGNAFADIVLGKVTPSGKLTDSWAFRYEDYPSSGGFSHNNGNVNEEYYTEGIYVGYRYFDTFNVPVRYGFGFGLSYTDFKTEVRQVSFTAGQEAFIRVSVKVANTGKVYSGREVVQLYVTCPAGDITKEYRRLAAFGKTGVLMPGEAEELELTIPVSALTSYSEAAPGWMLEAGPYVIWAGNSLDNSAPAAVMYVREDTLLTRTEAEKLPVIQVENGDLVCRNVEYRKNAELYTEEAMRFVDSLTTEEVVALATGDPCKGQGSNLGSAGISVPGSAGETNNCCLHKGLGSIVLSDGPAGLRLSKFYNVDQGEIVSMPFQFALEGGIFCPGAEEKMPGERYYQYCTAIPAGTLLAQTWDAELLREVGAMIGREMELFNTTLWLAPGMNIHRNPLCGRNFEYYSEDPLLSGKMAAAITAGVQTVPGCGTTIKHFACNNQEDNRMGVDSILSERALREIYLKGFEIAVREAQPMSVMTSYNLINGVHSANNYDICTDVARNEWGFKGVIMTDWTTTENGPDCTASGCMRAGNDLVMPGALSDRANLEKELSEGTLPMEDIKACVARLVDIIWQSNAYEEAVPYQK